MKKMTDKQKNRIEELEEKLVRLKKHSINDCKKGNHLCHSYRTSSGYSISECRVCPYVRHGTKIYGANR